MREYSLLDLEYDIVVRIGLCVSNKEYTRHERLIASRYIRPSNGWNLTETTAYVFSLCFTQMMAWIILGVVAVVAVVAVVVHCSGQSVYSAVVILLYFKSFFKIKRDWHITTRSK